jgi:5-methylcytosine-specific restriction endonuclease McrA
MRNERTTGVWAKRHGGDGRGGAPARRASKRRLLEIFGDGERCGCVHCGCELTLATLTRDRCEPGGSYAIANLQPACGDCNRRRSNNRNWTPNIAACALA